MYIGDNDDEHGDKYIMTKCVCVSPKIITSHFQTERRINLADAASFIKMNIFVE